jgi:aldose 1-epimerase
MSIQWIMEIQKINFGLEEWILSNRANDDYISVVPGAGGNVRSVKLAGKTIISGPDNQVDIQQDKNYRSALLFPWANRIKGGKYVFDNVAYQLPVNDLKSNNALHGYVYNQPFNVTKTVALADKCELEMQYVGNGDYPGYPFPFVLKFRVTLHSDSKMTIKFNVRNTGKGDMPFVLGWHPYFQFETEKANEWHIHIPADLKYELDNYNIPASSRNISDDYFIAVEDKYLNEIFLLNSTNGFATTSLSSSTSGYKINMWQKTGFNQLNYLMVYTPPDRKTIAVEPMSGCINAFNNKDGLILLAPDENMEFVLGCYVNT